jgi:hypothetical protein
MLPGELLDTLFCGVEIVGGFHPDEFGVLFLENVERRSGHRPPMNKLPQQRMADEARSNQQVDNSLLVEVLALHENSTRKQ